MMAALQTASGWTLRSLLEGLVALPVEADVVVMELCSDSRQISAGEVFIAYPGSISDGRDYIDAAVRGGAVAVLSHVDADSGGLTLNWHSAAGGNPVPVVGIPQLTDQVGVIADRFFGSPSRAMSVVGVTGTNGKTSCTHYLAQALSEQRCGVIGTLGWGLSGEMHASTHTTPDVLSVHRWLAQLHGQGARTVAMEVSSHALDQQRVAAVQFECAVFTNLSHEHLDYHGDMDRYGMAKRQLFERAGLKYAVINWDDPFGRNLLNALDAEVQPLSYGMAGGETRPDIHATDIQVEHSGLRFIARTPWGSATVRVPLLGRFNLSNVLAVLGVLLIKGMPLSEAVERLANLQPVAGRMQRFSKTDQPLVVVDYAHTPAALEHVLRALREHTRGELWCVFGCGGDRDRSKRAPMGHIAETLAEHVILSNDNPRGEDPLQIVQQIQAGMNDPEQARILLQRDEAIGEAIRNAKTEDVVLIAGKGHEDYQIIGAQRLSFSDAGWVEHYLQEGTP